MSAKYSARIHDPNHTYGEYNVYFNETLIHAGTNYFGDYIGMLTRDGTSVRVPDGITKIGQGTFRSMINLKNVYLPDGLNTIQPNAFFGCSSLEEIYLPDGLNIIQANAFYGCSSLEKIYLPASITSIAESVFLQVSNGIVIKCGFTEGSVEGAPWGAPAGATILYDQERPASMRTQTNTNTNEIHSEMHNVDLINKPDKSDINESEIKEV